MPWRWRNDSLVTFGACEKGEVTFLRGPEHALRDELSEWLLARLWLKGLSRLLAPILTSALYRGAYAACMRHERYKTPRLSTLGGMRAKTIRSSHLPAGCTSVGGLPSRQELYPALSC